MDKSGDRPARGVVRRRRRQWAFMHAMRMDHFAIYFTYFLRERRMAS